MRDSKIPDHVHKQVAALGAAFEGSLGVLFTITKSYDKFEFEQGLFGFIYAKPNKRLAKIFATDKELAILFTTFSDQQQRTISALQKHLQASHGRLESTIAVIVHADPEGNRKLKSWGREQGITVLPITAIPSVPDNATLERELLLDFFSNDPFDVTGPVSDDARFYGRRTEAVDIARQLQRGQIKACLGIRKIGKTSILNRILHELRTSHDCVCIMADCSRDDVWRMNAAQLLASLGNGIREATHRSERYSEIVGVKTGLGLPKSLSVLNSAVRDAGTTVVVMIDEVDYITPGSPTAKDVWRREFNLFWRNLRAVVQECARSDIPFSLFVSGVSSKWFKIEAIEGVENSALAFIPEDYLSPLAPAASAAMIRSLAKVAGLSFEDSVAEWVGQSCGNMPYWTRKACSYIHRNVDVRDRPSSVSRETAERLTQEFVAVEGAAIAEVALSHLFRVYPELYASAMSVLGGTSPRKDDSQIATLLRYGVLNLRQSRVLFGSLMIEAGMRRLTSVVLDDKPQSEPASEPPASALKLPINEWADELALINAARNKLERRLRALALNFIKFSSLQNKAGPSTSERLTKAIEPQRLDKLRTFPPDDLIEKFLWTELVRLIEREWQLFSPVFNDLRLFKQHAETVNERYDAHAKDADLADLAMYRKSLRWLEDAVQRTNA